jgi:hypothetical protein
MALGERLYAITQVIQLRDIMYKSRGELWRPPNELSMAQLGGPWKRVLRGSAVPFTDIALCVIPLARGLAITLSIKMGVEYNASCLICFGNGSEKPWCLHPPLSVAVSVSRQGLFPEP